MKKIIVKNAQTLTGKNTPIPSITDGEVLITGPEEMDASDGYHTFTELYDHRITLYIAFCKVFSIVDKAFPRFETDPGQEGKNPQTGKPKFLPVWRSKLHSDGSAFDGWFILGIGKEKGEQITYHLPNIKWDEVSFAETLEKAPEFDGHTSTDVLERIKKL